jgi:hypothetical protein
LLSTGNIWALQKMAPAPGAMQVSERPFTHCGPCDRQRESGDYPSLYLLTLPQGRGAPYPDCSVARWRRDAAAGRPREKRAALEAVRELNRQNQKAAETLFEPRAGPPQRGAGVSRKQVQPAAYRFERSSNTSLPPSSRSMICSRHSSTVPRLSISPTRPSEVMTSTSSASARTGIFALCVMKIIWRRFFIRWTALTHSLKNEMIVEVVLRLIDNKRVIPSRQKDR